MAYYILATKDDETAPWAPQFGAHDRELVQAERQDYRDHFHPAKWLKIITATCARRNACQAAINKLNGKE